MGPAIPIFGAAAVIFSALFGGSQAADNAFLRYQLEQAQQREAEKDAKIVALEPKAAEADKLRQANQNLLDELGQERRRNAAETQEKEALGAVLGVVKEAYAAKARSNDTLSVELNKLGKEYVEWTDRAQKRFDELHLETWGWMNRALGYANKVNALEKTVRARDARIAALEALVASQQRLLNEKVQEISRSKVEVSTLKLKSGEAEDEKKALEKIIKDLKTYHRTTMRNTVIGVALPLLLVIFGLVLWLLRSRRQ